MILSKAQFPLGGDGKETINCVSNVKGHQKTVPILVVLLLTYQAVPKRSQVGGATHTTRCICKFVTKWPPLDSLHTLGSK